MKKYIAKCDLGKYLKGMEVPENIAKMYMKMYDVSPVDLVDSDVKEEVKKTESKTPIKAKTKDNPLDVDGDGDVDVDDVIAVAKGATKNIFSRKKRSKK